MIQVSLTRCWNDRRPLPREPGMPVQSQEDTTQHTALHFQKNILAFCTSHTDIHMHTSLVQEDPLEKEMATHSSILAWEIPWTEKPSGLQSMGLQRVKTWLSNWATIYSTLCKFLCKELCWVCRDGEWLLPSENSHPNRRGLRSVEETQLPDGCWAETPCAVLSGDHCQLGGIRMSFMDGRAFIMALEGRVRFTQAKLRDSRLRKQTEK